MGGYVDGFVMAVPKKNLPAYRKMALAAGKVWKKCGALEYYECVGDDLNPAFEQDGKKSPWPGIKFTKMINAKAGDAVVFSFIVFKSRAHRDSVNAKVMKDPFMNDQSFKDKPMPFDIKRAAYGGFTTLVKY